MVPFLLRSVHYLTALEVTMFRRSKSRLLARVTRSFTRPDGKIVVTDQVDLFDHDLAVDFAVKWAEAAKDDQPLIALPKEQT